MKVYVVFREEGPVRWSIAYCATNEVADSYVAAMKRESGDRRAIFYAAEKEVIERLPDGMAEPIAGGSKIA